MGRGPDLFADTRRGYQEEPRLREVLRTAPQALIVGGVAAAPGAS